MEHDPIYSSGYGPGLGSTHQLLSNPLFSDALIDNERLQYDLQSFLECGSLIRMSEAINSAALLCRHGEMGRARQHAVDARGEFCNIDIVIKLPE